VNRYNNKRLTDPTMRGWPLVQQKKTKRFLCDVSTDRQKMRSREQSTDRQDNNRSWMATTGLDFVVFDSILTLPEGPRTGMVKPHILRAIVSKPILTTPEGLGSKIVDPLKLRQGQRPPPSTCAGFVPTCT
jgi:hypothetical protein